MGSISDFLDHMDWEAMLAALFSAVAALMCLTIHELSHGAVAYALGDPTAKRAGRLTLNPIRHIDPFGLLLMITAHVGWAKPVPVDMRYFKKPKRDMALTALAGPASNFVLAWLFMLVASLLWHVLSFAADWQFYLLRFFLQAAMLSAGLGVFNLFPVPPLDGSRILFAFFPDRVYYAVMRYERYIMLAVLALVWLGALDRPLSYLIVHILQGLCALSGVPFELFYFI